MALSSSVGGITGVNTSKGSTRVFTVQEMQIVGGSLQPTGVSFGWSNENFSAPRGPWQYALQLRTVRRDLPGSEEPVEQVLGWNYAPFTIQGVWDDRHAGANYATQTRQDFEAMVKRGNPVQVQFEKIAVTGLITHLQINYMRQDRIGYQFTFSPHFRYEGESVRTEVNPSRSAKADPRTTVKNVRTALENLKAAQAIAQASNLSRVQQLLTSSVFSDVNGYLNDLEGYVTKVEKTADDEILVAEDATNALKRGAQVLESVKTAVASIISRTSAVVVATDMALDTYVETLQFDQWLRGVNGAARILGLQASQSQTDLLLKADSKPNRLHRVRQGETLYSISNLYYGTPFHWQEILAYNHLSSIILNGGELLTIPELKS